MDLNQFLRIIRNMEPIIGRQFKPHRYLALLAVLDIIENKIEKEKEPKNEFYYNDEFKQYFTKYFQIYHGSDDHDRPFKPFFHLKNAGGFWFLKPITGKESDFNKLKEASPGKLNEIVEYSYLLPEIFGILSDPKSREIVRKEIENCLKTGLQTKL